MKPHLSPRPLGVALLLALLVGCATWVAQSMEQRFGPRDPARFDRAAVAAPGAPSYQLDIKPILDKRCAVCHGCYDAPCQLKLTRWDGIARGLSKASVYGELRLREAELTRLGVDALLASQWRAKGFESVLNEHHSEGMADLQASVLWRSLDLKRAHPLPDQSVLPAADFDFDLNRSNSCPSAPEFEAYARNRPHAGMPYGLPGLSEAELTLIRRWLLAGAPGEGLRALLVGPRVPLVLGAMPEAP